MKGERRVINGNKTIEREHGEIGEEAGSAIVTSAALHILLFSE